MKKIQNICVLTDSLLYAKMITKKWKEVNRMVKNKLNVAVIGCSKGMGRIHLNGLSKRKQTNYNQISGEIIVNYIT